MKRVVIAGAGFAGISALKPLGRYASAVPEDEIIIFDKNDFTTMMPSLPDVAAGRLKQGVLKVNIRNLLPKGVQFRNEEITKIDLDVAIVTTASSDYHYDYLIFCPGSVTNFYGFGQHLDQVFVLDSLRKALRLQEEFDRYLRDRNSRTLLISGAGFTGLEAACFLGAHARANSKALKVVIVEKNDRVLGNMPGEVSGYVNSLLSDLEVRVLTNSSIESFDGRNVTLETGEVFEDAFFVWTSGSKRAIGDISGTFSTLPDGRLIVNRFLQLPDYENVFVGGDGAAIKRGDVYLRKAAAFSVASGRWAGRNVVRSLENKRLIRYRPFDIGWVIPLYPSSIGKVTGVTIKGRPGLSFHYLACGYRSHSIINRTRYGLMALKSLMA